MFNIFPSRHHDIPLSRPPLTWHVAQIIFLSINENFDVEKGLDKSSFDNTLKSLTAEEYIKLNVIERKEIELTDEGKSYAQNGSPEF